MNPTADPNTQPQRKILLAVAAKSPQIITETIYALANQAEPWIPTELHIITTGRGARNIQQDLSRDGANWLERLCQDYHLPRIELANEHLHVITDSQQQVLEDIRNTADNACAADYITQKTRELTADPHSSLYASLSGGRRTMTYYMGYALSLFGRPQDRLLHVLVEDEYFFNKEFYYPPPHSKQINCPNGSTVDAAHIEVTLAELPFLRLRETLPTELFSGAQRFTDIIAATQAQIIAPRVQFNWATHELICGETPMKMPPAQLAFYVWMLERKASQLAPIPWSSKEVPSPAQQFLKIYKALYSETGHFEKIERTLNQEINHAWFDEHKSKTNTYLKKKLSPAQAANYLIYSHGTRPNTSFGLSLFPESLHFQNA
jgi:CRISPR-associated protein (TIGR02584 family)